MAARRVLLVALYAMAAVCAFAEPNFRRELRSAHSRTLTQCSTSNFCQGKDSKNYANPCSSSSFIQCSNGKTAVTACPSGLVYVSSSDRCDYASSSTSNASPPNSPAPTPASAPSPSSAPSSPAQPSGPSGEPLLPHHPQVIHGAWCSSELELFQACQRLHSL